jgi:hypothetical protein
MKTDDLISALAQDTVAEAHPARVLAYTLPPALMASFALMWAYLGLRADLPSALTSFPPLWRHVLALGLFGVAATLGWRLLRPEGRAPLAFLLIPLLAALAVLAWGILSTPQEGWQMALQGKTQMVCLIWVPLLSIAPVAAFLLAFRQGAPDRPAFAGALAGLAGGGLGAAVYAMHCIEDNPMFFVTWYGVAIAGVTVVAALIGARILRW